jgi:phosphoglycolate phosphatase
MLLQALEATTTDARDAALIGDTAFDMEMARAAHFDAIGVAWGYHRADRLFASGARRVVNDAAELRECILSEIL